MGLYHRPDCPEVTKKAGSRAENWLSYDPARVPLPNRRRACKRCIPERNEARSDY